MCRMCSCTLSYAATSPVQSPCSLATASSVVRSRCMCISAFSTSSVQWRGLTLFKTAAIWSAFSIQRACASASLALSPAFAAADDVGGDQNVRAQLPGQLVTRRVPVEGLDGVTDVGLVLQEPPDRRVRVGGPCLEADDRQPRPGDVILPELAHVLAQCHCLRRKLRRMVDALRRLHRRVRVVSCVAMGLGHVHAVRDGQGSDRANEGDQPGQGDRDRARSPCRVHDSVPFGCMRVMRNDGRRNKLATKTTPVTSIALVKSASPSTASRSGWSTGTPIVIVSA